MAAFIAGLAMLVVGLSWFTTFSLKQTSMYSYLIMLIFIFGGMGLVLKALLKPSEKG